MRYFLPDWDDRVDPRFDFEFELPAVDRDPHRDDVYAHEYFRDDDCYDGILVSRSALGETGRKRREVDRIGLRKFLRLPPRYELMGDCGAFGYVKAPIPIYETPELLDFYQRVGVNYGVSIDHIIFPSFPEQRQFRYDLTINNAIEFLERHRSGPYTFTPVGAVQGWDVGSYAEAARRLAAAGYDMLAVGGLVRSRTSEILAIANGVAAAVGPSVRLHLLGVARDSIIPDLSRLGIFSFDSASPMRTAWMSANKNYLLGDGYYTAIRIPPLEPETKGVRGNNILTRAQSSLSYAERERLEIAALRAVRGYSRNEVTLDDAIASIEAYDREQTRGSEVEGQHPGRGDALTGLGLDDAAASVEADDREHARDIKAEAARAERMQEYRRTLTDRPWTHCDCRVCQDVGIEVVIFRRNDRNRRRGFHNVRDFYKGLKNRERRVREIEQTSLGI